MKFHTAHSDSVDRLYHWEPFNKEWLRRLLCDRTIYCSTPANFNDPWDCKPHFNTDLLKDRVEHDKHVQWAVDVCKRHNRMSTKDITRMEERLRTDREFLATTIQQVSENVCGAISARYRVYCLGPDVGNLLLWSHYADRHQGICIEFSTHNEVMCCPLRIEYVKDYPEVRAYSTDESENLVPLLTKADMWCYEREYRLIAQERGSATNHKTLMTDDNFLKLPEGAVLSVIVGCQGNYDLVRRLVAEVAPNIAVRRACRVSNRFKLQID